MADEALVIKFPSVLTRRSGGDFKKSFFEQIDEAKPPKVVCDCSELEHIDSQGIAHVVEMYRLTKLDGIDVEFTNLSEHILQVFRVTKLDGLFDVAGQTPSF